MQRVHAIDDLLQGPIGNDPRENDIATLERRRHPARPEAANDAFPRRDAWDSAAGADGATELVRVPALSRGEDGDGSDYFVSSPVSTLNPPLANTGMSSPTALNPGVDVPFLSASIDVNVSSPFR